LPADLPRWMVLAAHLNHAGIYALLLTAPILGFLATNAFGFPLTWYGLIGPIPSPVGKNVPLAEILLPIHRGMVWTLAAMLAMHIPAALFHHFVRRDDTLRRML
jgi:cytochrome b561